MTDKPDSISEKNNTEAQEDKEKGDRPELSARNAILTEITLKHEESETPRVHYLRISSVTEEIVSITSDTLLPRDTDIKLKLILSQPIEAEVRLLWYKEIGIKNYLMGLEFNQRARINRSGIPALLKWAEPRYGKRSFRINSQIYFETDFTGAKDSTNNRFYGLVVVISPDGMELKNKFPFPEDIEFTIKFSLSNMVIPLTTRSRVIFQRDIKPRYEALKLSPYYQIWLEFLEPELIKKHISECLGPEAGPMSYVKEHE